MTNDASPTGNSHGTSIGLVYLGIVCHATAYGTSFLLPLRVATIGGTEADVGRVLGLAMAAAIATGLYAGHIADRLGRPASIALASLVQAASLAGLAMIADVGVTGLPLGVGLGIGWSLFYLVGPLLVISIAPRDQRVAYLTIVSALQMLGVGLGPTIGRLTLGIGGTSETVLLVGSGLSVAAAMVFWIVGRRRDTSSENALGAASLRLGDFMTVFSTKAAVPTIMIALGGSIFGCLSNYQTSIAAHLGVDFSLFFIVFVGTVVTSRLSLASVINAQRPYPAALLLLGLMCSALAVYAFLDHGGVSFSITTIVFAIGYGLTYSVLNGIVANIDETAFLQKALLIFPISYFVGLYGFPFVGGWIISTIGVDALLIVLLALGLVEWSLAWIGHRSRPRER